MQSGVIISTPTTLIALLLAVAEGWREQKITENAEEVSRLGRELYSRMATFVGHLEALGKSLDKSVDNFNKAVGSLDRNLLSTTRKFRQLEVTSDEEIDVPKQIESKARNTPHLGNGDYGASAVSSSAKVTGLALVAEPHRLSIRAQGVRSASAPGAIEGRGVAGGGHGHRPLLQFFHAVLSHERPGSGRRVRD